MINLSAFQFYVFIACISIGYIGGNFFIVFMPLRKISNNNIIKILIDLISFVALTILYIFLSFKFNFPSIRFYMIIGVLVGVYIYFESLYIPLAKLLKTVYNIIIKKRNNKKLINKNGF